MMSEELYFRVKNWEHFQHYRDRTPPWIKLYSTLLSDPDFITLPDSAKAHLMLIWLLASQHRNRCRACARYVRRAIGANQAVNLKALIDAGFLILINPLEENNDSTLLSSCYQVATQSRVEESRVEKSRGDNPPTPLERGASASPAKRGHAVKKTGLIEPEKFEQFWQAYPRRIGKGAAEKAWSKAITSTPADTLIENAQKFALLRRGQDPSFTPHPTTWLNQRRWEDQPDPEPSAPAGPPLRFASEIEKEKNDEDPRP